MPSRKFPHNISPSTEKSNPPIGMCNIQPLRRLIYCARDNYFRYATGDHLEKDHSGRVHCERRHCTRTYLKLRSSLFRLEPLRIISRRTLRKRLHALRWELRPGPLSDQPKRDENGQLVHTREPEPVYGPVGHEAPVLTAPHLCRNGPWKIRTGLRKNHPQNLGMKA